MAENLVLLLYCGLPCVCALVLIGLARHHRRRAACSTWLDLLIWNGLAVLFLSSLVILGGEIYYRFFCDEADSLSYTKLCVRWYERHWHVNADNLRDNIEYRNEIARGERRMTFVGDSFTAGHGVKDVEDRFVNRIRRAHPEWEVHMLAVPGMDTGDELECMKKCLSGSYQLDRVVLVYCLNDISDLMPERFAATAQVRTNLAQCGWLVRNSYFLNTIYHRLSVRSNPFMQGYYDMVRTGYEGPLWDKQVERLRSFRSLIEAHGGRLSVVTFPFLHALGAHYPYASVHKQLEEFWHKEGVPYFDLLAVYGGLPPGKVTVNRFDAHPNEYAHALAAEAIGSFLAAQH